MKQTIVLPILLAVFGLSAGYFLRSGTHFEKASIDQADNVGSRAESLHGSRRETSHTFAVKRDLARSDGQDNWLQWIAGVENASLDDLPQLARMAGDNEGALQIISLRWMELDPDHLYRTLLKESRFLLDGDDGSAFPYRKLSQFLFREWPKKDFEGAIAALSGEGNLLNQNGLRMGVLNAVIQSDPRRGLEILKEWGIRNYGPDTKGIEKWAGKDPQAAAAAIVETASGYGSEYAMTAVGKVWANDDPEAALAYSRSLSGELGFNLRNSAFDTWAKKDLQAASKWLSEQDDLKLQDALRPAVIRQWAKDDPQAALTWTNENLDGRYRADAVAELVQGVVTMDRKLAGTLVMQLKPGPGRERAAKIVAREWFPDEFASSTNAKADPEAIAWLKGLDDPKSQEAAFGEISQGWGAADPGSLKNFLATEEGPLGSARTISRNAHFFAKGDPVGNLKWAEELGPERAPEVSKAIFSSWMRDQPGIATDWFKEIPRNDPHRAPILDGYLSRMNFLPEATAIEQLRALAPEDRAQLHQAGLQDGKANRLLQAAEEK